MFTCKILKCVLNTSLTCMKTSSFMSVRNFSLYVCNRTLIHVHKNSGLNNSIAPVVNSIRNYAKGKDKKKEKGKTKVEINENEIGEIINIEALKTQLDKNLIHLKEEFVKHLSLRSTTGAIESLPVSYDGKQHTLQEIAQIVRKNPKTIVVNMSVFPDAIKAALKSIEKSGMNLNPQQEGTTLYIPIPQVTKEYRDGLAKNAKALFVKFKDNTRDTQNKFIKQIKRKDGISSDTAKSVELQVIAFTDKFLKEGETILDSKLKELTGDKK